MEKGSVHTRNIFALSHVILELLNKLSRNFHDTRQKYSYISLLYQQMEYTSRMFVEIARHIQPAILFYGR